MRRIGGPMKKMLKLFALIWCVQQTRTATSAMMFVNTLPHDRMVEAKVTSSGEGTFLVFFRADLPAEYNQLVNGEFILYEKTGSGRYRPAQPHVIGG